MWTRDLSGSRIDSSSSNNNSISRSRRNSSSSSIRFKVKPLLMIYSSPSCFPPLINLFRSIIIRQSTGSNGGSSSSSGSSSGVCTSFLVVRSCDQNPCLLGISTLKCCRVPICLPRRWQRSVTPAQQTLTKSVFRPSPYLR